MCRPRGCIKGVIHAIIEHEELGRTEKGTDRRECLDLTEQTCLRDELEQKLEKKR